MGGKKSMALLNCLPKGQLSRGGKNQLPFRAEKKGVVSLTEWTGF